ncbi:MAG TPA: TRAP transporter substrate-binding protein, partial [bacterium]|nr:TRAP transporter substrate-binding protein [bacterium]
MRRIMTVVLAAIVVIVAPTLYTIPQAGAQQRIIVRLGHVGFPDSLFEITAQEFARRVNRELAGRVEVRVFHSSQLGTDEDMIRGV